MFQSARAPRCAPHSFETLEDRRLMSSAWTIDGTDAADTIRVRQAGDTVSVTRNGSTTRRSDVSQLTINGKGGNDVIAADGSVTVTLVLHGGGGNDALTGGAGDDRLYGETGSDTLAGGAGDDVLVTLGGSSDRDRLSGNSGRDNFWADVSPVDRITDATGDDWTHAVGSFANYQFMRSGAVVSRTTASVRLAGQELPDPLAKDRVTWNNFSGQPLFAPSGPGEQDIDQNAANDCYFLATLAAVARTAPQRITSRVVDLGDGTYAVNFTRDGKDVYVRVDGDLPVTASGALQNAGFGRSGSIWVPILEKAWAFFRRSEGSYGSIDLGRAGEVFAALGVADVHFTSNPDSFRPSGGMLNAIDGFLKKGAAVTYWTLRDVPAGCQLWGAHVMTVVRVVRNSKGVPTGMVVRDPYKTDGRGSVDGSNDGYMTVSAPHAAAAMRGLTWAWA